MKACKNVKDVCFDKAGSNVQHCSPKQEQGEVLKLYLYAL